MSEQPKSNELAETSGKSMKRGTNNKEFVKIKKECFCWEGSSFLGHQRGEQERDQKRSSSGSAIGMSDVENFIKINIKKLQKHCVLQWCLTIPEIEVARRPLTMVFREKTLQKHCVLQAILATARRRVVHMVATAIEEIRTPSASAVGEKKKRNH